MSNEVEFIVSIATSGSTPSVEIMPKALENDLKLIYTLDKAAEEDWEITGVGFCSSPEEGEQLYYLPAPGATEVLLPSDAFITIDPAISKLTLVDRNTGPKQVLAFQIRYGRRVEKSVSFAHDPQVANDPPGN